MIEYVHSGVEIAEWIVRQRGEVDDRVELLEIARPHGAHVAARWTAELVRAEVTAAIEERVEPDDVVARVPQQRRERPSRCSRDAR